MNILSNEQISALPEWLAVRGFEGLYEVNCREGIVRNARTLRVFKTSLNNNGYPRVGLSKDRKQYFKTVHRLVAVSAFGYYNIPTDGLEVCHLDEERWDGRISNLSLGSHKENMSFPKAKQRHSDRRKGKFPSVETKNKMSEAHPKKAVGAFKDGRLILKFESTKEAGKNSFNQSAIINCCKGKRKHHRGLEWKYLTA